MTLSFLKHERTPNLHFQCLSLYQSKYVRHCDPQLFLPLFQPTDSSYQYLVSLQAHRSTTGVGASSSSKRKKGKLALLDLNGDSDDEGDGGDSSIPEKEMRASSQLEAVLTKCQKCGTSVYCKIAADGSHVNLTFQQRRAWAITLVCPVLPIVLDSSYVMHGF